MLGTFKYFNESSLPRYDHFSFLLVLTKRSRGRYEIEMDDKTIIMDDTVIIMDDTVIIIDDADRYLSLFVLYIRNDIDS